jgi:SAM-dependent methyltransferase
MPEAYDQWLAPAMFQPFAVDLARRAARLSPYRVLEIAAGTGVLTRELVAAIPAADVTATDLNVAMVEYGSRRAPAPDDPPAFVAAVPHGYSDTGQAVADLAAGGLGCVSAEPVTLDGLASSAADVAAGFCTGTPLRLAIEARGDLTATMAVVSDEMRTRLGDGPVTARMTAYVIDAQ